MEPGTQALLIIGLTTVVIPLLTTIGASWALYRMQVRRASLIGLGLGFLVSFGGVLELTRLWGSDAIKWLLIAPTLGVALALMTEAARAGSTSRSGPVQAVALGLVFSLCALLVSAPLTSIWSAGVGRALLNEWLISALLLAWLSCRESLCASSLSGHEGVSAAHFASLALTFGVAAPVVGLSGSASVAQLLGAYGLSVAGVGLLALARRVELGRFTYLFAYLGLFSALLYAHLYLVPSLSSAVAALLLVAPSVVSLTVKWAARPALRVALTLALTLPFVGLALWLVAAESSAAQSAQEVDEFGASY